MDSSSGRMQLRDEQLTIDANARIPNNKTNVSKTENACGHLSAHIFFVPSDADRG